MHWQTYSRLCLKARRAEEIGMQAMLQISNECAAGTASAHSSIGTSMEDMT
jgi:hypothetical protein